MTAQSITFNFININDYSSVHDLSTVDSIPASRDTNCRLLNKAAFIIATQLNIRDRSTIVDTVHEINMQQDRQCTLNVTLWDVRLPLFPLQQRLVYCWPTSLSTI